MISTLISLPYEVARLPLAVVDRTLTERLGATSGPHLVLDRAIGSADRVAGALLFNRAISERGARRLEESDKLRAAADLERQAAAHREQADEAAVSGRQRAAQKREAAQQRAASGLAEADAAEARGKQEATTRARKSAAAKKASADRRADSKSDSAQRRQGSVEAAVDAKEKAAEQEAHAELEDAQQHREAAAQARGDADRLSDLTEARKQERTEG